MISKRNSDSKVQLSWHFKKLLKPTLLDYLKTQTYVQFTPEESPSCPEIFNWPEELEERDFDISYIKLTRKYIILIMWITKSYSFIKTRIDFHKKLPP